MFIISPHSALLLPCLALSLSYSADASARDSDAQVESRHHLEVSSYVDLTLVDESPQDPGKAKPPMQANVKHLEENAKPTQHNLVVKTPADGTKVFKYVREIVATKTSGEPVPSAVAKTAMLEEIEESKGSEEFLSSDRTDDRSDLGILVNAFDSENGDAAPLPESATSTLAGGSTLTGRIKSKVHLLAAGSQQTIFLGSIVYLLLGLCCAHLYNQARMLHPKTFTPEPRPEIMPSSVGFTFGLFEFFSDRNLCIIGCCCPFLRWSDTVDRQGLLSFWKAFLATFLLLLLHLYTYGISDIALVLLGITYRQKLRSRFLIESGTSTSLLNDCLVWTCCQPCAIIQEAHEESVQRGV